MLDRGADIRSVYLVAPGLAVIDLNAAFADGHPSSVLAEDLTTLSLVETLSANLATVRRVKILVDGKERDTLAGHVDLHHFVDAERAHEAAKELEAPQ